MIRTINLTALTRVCFSGPALFIGWASDMLMRNRIVTFSFLSGFVGSLFAQQFTVITLEGSLR
jgi:hypothetical protein